MENESQFIWNGGRQERLLLVVPL
ncbi:hypothetical protein MPNT_290003 [Candidatus Methylacidithermus pantelleriae]|uniref:Uncharacterized protein n=1 Tax=Candidatus Methylacidithermus pantelleriae TaxID=2744239 RepID=A0A8J2FNX2_9BACT|nr:hypothetical protein MPNT_290003 [Candidatus Methylacidithermus pantelleriae]